MRIMTKLLKASARENISNCDKGKQKLYPKKQKHGDFLLKIPQATRTWNNSFNTRESLLTEIVYSNISKVDVK